MVCGLSGGRRWECKVNSLDRSKHPLGRSFSSTAVQHSPTRLHQLLISPALCLLCPIPGQHRIDNQSRREVIRVSAQPDWDVPC